MLDLTSSELYSSIFGVTKQDKSFAICIQGFWDDVELFQKTRWFDKIKKVEGNQITRCEKKRRVLEKKYQIWYLENYTLRNDVVRILKKLNFIVLESTVRKEAFEKNSYLKF